MKIKISWKTRSETFNWNGLPNIVKAQYKDRTEKKLIKRSDIFVLVGDKWKPRTYRNDFTKETSSTPGIPGMQRSSTMIQYPDNAYSAVNGVHTIQFNYVINMGGYVTGFLDQLTKEQEKDFTKCANKMETWDACSFYHFYEDFSDKARSFGIWVVPYPLFKKGFSDTRGFVCGDPFADETVMIPDRYIPTLRSMSFKIHKVLRYEDVLPLEGKKILDTTNCGYEALYAMARLFHPFLVEDATRLSPDLTRQNRDESFDSWIRKANFHCAMEALMNDVVHNLGSVWTQNSYINKLCNHEEIMEIAKQERASPNASDQENYTKGIFLTHLRALHDECERSASSRLNSLLHRPGDRHTSRLHALEAAVGYNKLSNSIKDDVYLGDAESLLPYVVNNVDIQRHIQSNPDAVKGLLHLIHAVSNVVQSNDIRRFDQQNQACAVCKGYCHPFDSCPILQNPADMKQSLIRISTAFRRFQRVVDALGRPPQEVAARGLNAINAVAAFNLLPSSPSPSLHMANDSSSIINHLTTLILQIKPVLIPFIVVMSQMFLLPCQHSMHTSPGWNSDFRFSPR